MRPSWRVFQASGLLVAASVCAQEEEESAKEAKSYWEDLTDGTIDLFEDEENQFV